MFVIGGCHERSYDLPSIEDGYCWKLMNLLKLNLKSISIMPSNEKTPTNMERMLFLKEEIKKNNVFFFLIAMFFRIRSNDDDQNNVDLRDKKITSELLNLFFTNLLELEKKQIQYIILDTGFINKDNFEIVNKFTERTCKSGFVMFPPKYMSIYNFCKSKGFPHNELYHYGPEAHTAWAQYIYDNYMEWKTKK